MFHNQIAFRNAHIRAQKMLCELCFMRIHKLHMQRMRSHSLSSMKHIFKHMHTHLQQLTALLQSTLFGRRTSSHMADKDPRSVSTHYCNIVSQAWWFLLQWGWWAWRWGLVGHPEWLQGQAEVTKMLLHLATIVQSSGLGNVHDIHCYYDMKTDIISNFGFCCFILIIHKCIVFFLMLNARLKSPQSKYAISLNPHYQWSFIKNPIVFYFFNLCNISSM